MWRKHVVCSEVTRVDSYTCKWLPLRSSKAFCSLALISSTRCWQQNIWWPKRKDLSGFRIQDQTFPIAYQSDELNQHERLWDLAVVTQRTVLDRRTRWWDSLNSAWHSARMGQTETSRGHWERSVEVTEVEGKCTHKTWQEWFIEGTEYRGLT